METKKNELEAVDKFRSRLMDEFLSLCSYNDYNKINLLSIGNAVDRVFSQIIEEIKREL